jgi:hypothetical protein
MTELSPASQVVLAALLNSPVNSKQVCDGKAPQIKLAAALRAAADQVVPESEPPQRGDFSDLSVYQWAVDIHAHDEATRSKLLAIAAELESQP